MVITKRYLLRLFFLLEIIIFIGIYLFSAQGLQVLRSMKKDNLQVKVKIASLQDEIVELEEEVQEWQNNSFYKEKIAREELQMAKTGDEVYFL
jgi:cell division protein FtsB